MKKTMKRTKWWLPALILLTAFQLISMAQVVFNDDGSLSTECLIFFGAYLAVEWVYFIAMSIARKRADPALEMIAFFLTGIGLVTVAGANKDLVKTQFVADMLGIFCFVALLWLISNVDRAMVMRTPMAVAAIGLLVLTLILARNIKGAFNWLSIGGMSIQPSEFVKVAFVFVGAAMAAGLVVLIRSDFVMARFATYRHVWDDMYGKGYQQTRVLIYSVSGGLLGVGIGDGKLKEVPAATEDLVFGMICEEWGIIMGILVILCIMFIAFHSIRCASGSRSAFYAISGIAAGCLLLFQTGLNVFGVTDLLPLTGVTLPFISRGGSSAICCWALIAFIKAADNRTWIGSKYYLDSDS